MFQAAKTIVHTEARGMGAALLTPAQGINTLASAHHGAPWTVSRRPAGADAARRGCPS